MLVPNQKLWVWPFAISLIIAFGFAISLYVREDLNFKFTDGLLWVLLPYLFGLILGAATFIGYVRWSDNQKIKNLQTTPKTTAAEKE